MYEYEFRLVIQHTESLQHKLKEIYNNVGYGTFHTQHILYAKPHFRYRNRRFETKSVVSAQAVHHRELWFKWVQSIELPYSQWSHSTHSKFLDVLGNFACPFQTETRQVLQLDAQAQVYTFQHADGSYRMVFEWEYGTFPQTLDTIPGTWLLEKLETYWQVYCHFYEYSTTPYRLNENVIRKPVTCIPNHSNSQLMARKLDGIFGFVYSYPHQVYEKWEDSIQKRHKGITLGDGIVYSAERMTDGTIILLDVYQARGLPVASWCRRSILIEYLPSLMLPSGFKVQQYCANRADLNRSPFKTDGFIIHDTDTDDIFKIKRNHSLDVVYRDGYFWLPSKDRAGLSKRFKCLEDGLVNGHVYEVSILTGRVLRKRTDRFMGNTHHQIENIICGKRKWKGPPIQDVLKDSKKKFQKKSKCPESGDTNK